MLLRFDPFRDLDHVFGEVMRRPSVRSIPMDAYRRGDMFFVHFDLPGVDSDSIDLTVDKDVLTVKAERAWKEQEGDELVACERPQGTFQRQLYLSESVDREHLEARYQDGVLTVRLPMLEEAKPRKVQVTTGEVRKAVEGTTSEAKPTAA